MKRLLIIAMSLATALAGAPVQAAPPMTPAFAAAAEGSAPRAEPVGCNNLTNCPQLNPRWNSPRPRYFNEGRGWRSDRWERHGWDRGRYYDRNRYYHRRHNSGAVIGGLAAGAILGAIVSQPRGRSYGGSHVEYCSAKYRSYRAYDNTYQPTNGPRRQCR